MTENEQPKRLTMKDYADVPAIEYVMRPPFMAIEHHAHYACEHPPEVEVNKNCEEVHVARLHEVQQSIVHRHGYQVAALGDLTIGCHGLEFLHGIVPTGRYVYCIQSVIDIVEVN